MKAGEAGRVTRSRLLPLLLTLALPVASALPASAQVGGIRHAPGHIQGDHDKTLRTNLFDGGGDIAAHQGAGQHEQADAGQPHHRSDGGRQLVLTDQRDSIH